MVSVIVEDPSIYQDFKLIAIRRNFPVTKLLWKFINDTVIADRLEKQSMPSMDSFTSVTPPPRIIEDFENVIRPYLNKANPETLKLVMDTGYFSYVYSKYLILADRHHVMPHDKRILRNVPYRQAVEGLEWLSHLKGEGYVKDIDLLQRMT